MWLCLSLISQESLDKANKELEPLLISLYPFMFIEDYKDRVLVNEAQLLFFLDLGSQLGSKQMPNFKFCHCRGTLMVKEVMVHEIPDALSNIYHFHKMYKSMNIGLYKYKIFNDLSKYKRWLL